MRLQQRNDFVPVVGAGDQFDLGSLVEIRLQTLPKNGKVAGQQYWKSSCNGGHRYLHVAGVILKRNPLYEGAIPMSIFCHGEGESSAVLEPALNVRLRLNLMTSV